MAGRRVSSSSRPSPPPQRPLPLQNFQLKKEDFSTDDGIARINTLFQQHAIAIQALQGSGGRTVLPSGVDVQGSTVSGLAPPSGETDAISSGHAQGQFSAPVLAPKLDIGGPNALKGLTGLTLQFGQLQSQLASTIPAYTGGNVIKINGSIIQFSLIVDMDTAVFPMNFPEPFPNACQSLLAFSTLIDRVVYAPSLPTLTQFTLANNGTGAGAFWVAFGY